MKNLRAESLDSLRGFAIFMMVLSGSILTWVLPAWMAHAQCPPPTGTFDKSVYGITWVDLVFPFFLFSMGAAYPFAIGSRIKRGAGKGRLIIDSIWRFIKLAYFALFLYHINPWALAAGEPAGVSDWLITLCGFLLLFAIYLRIPWNLNPWVRRAIHWIGVAIATAIMIWVDTRNGCIARGLVLRSYRSSWASFSAKISTAPGNSTFSIGLLCPGSIVSTF